MTELTASHDIPHVVVLCNFGGPTGPGEVEPFLRALFNDPFIIRTPLKPALRAWLARRIAKKRAPKAQDEYQSIGFSPINRMTTAQAQHLEALLKKKRPTARVVVVNRYTEPFADTVVKALDPASSRIFILTLYPHLCHSTTVSSLRDFDLAFERCHGHSQMPSTRIFSWWHHPRYLKHTFTQLSAALAPLLAHPEPISVVFSAHGLPERYRRRGDPYVTEIEGHFTELRRLGERWLSPEQAARCRWHLSYQSRVGPVEWVKPYTDETLRRLGKEHGGSLLLVPISFTADHIETLYEMDHTYRELALKSGFKRFARAVPSNDDPELAACLAEVLYSHGF